MRVLNKIVKIVNKFAGKKDITSDHIISVIEKNKVSPHQEISFQ